jgi:Ca2+-binding RTX toxin-like protein
MSRKNRKPYRTLKLETLESRQLMAAGIVQTGSTLMIEGTTGNDTIEVRQVSSDLVVSFNGQDFRGSASNVKKVKFFGANGDDRFVNLTSIPSIQSGGNGNDTLIGGDGNDVLTGGRGNDRLEGGRGHDRYVFGGSNLGSDRITGTTSGVNSLDFRKRGGSSKVDLQKTGWQTVKSGHLMLKLNSVRHIDKVYGSKYDDKIYGNELNNKLYGSGGNDKIYGRDGHDVVSGGTGNDLVSGNDGNDRVYGGDGHDRVFGGDHRDKLYGGEGNDTLYGGDGYDKIWGYHGHDNLYGGGDDDYLSGGSGNDGLFGGLGRETMRGGSGADRFLVRAGSSIKDRTSSDAVIRFVEGTGGSWNDGEIQQLDKGLQFLHHRKGNTRLLKDTITTNDLRIYKASGGEGWVGLNRTGTRNGKRYREIHIVDFNYNNDSETASRISTLVHEIAHNWDEEAPTSLRNAFRAESGWTSRNPHSSSYVRSGDRDWWHHRNANFARDYGKTNPREDFATSFQVYYRIYKQYGRSGIFGTPGANTGIQGKLKVIDRIIEAA